MVLVRGTVSQNTVVAVESDQPGDTATGTDVIVNVERGSIQYYYRENIVQTFFFCSRRGLQHGVSIFDVRTRRCY